MSGVGVNYFYFYFYCYVIFVLTQDQVVMLANYFLRSRHTASVADAYHVLASLQTIASSKVLVRVCVCVWCGSAAGCIYVSHRCNDFSAALHCAGLESFFYARSFFLLSMTSCYSCYMRHAV